VKKFSAGLGALLALLAFLPLQPAAAAADPLMIMVIAEEWPELERQAEQRLEADPMDSAALHALGRLSIDPEVGSERLRQALLKQAESCIAARPADPLCQLAYGQILGVELNHLGMFDALGSVGKVQQAFEAAVAGAPQDFDARESLLTFYLRAPGFVGGSSRRARKNADDFARIDADRARLLYALIDLQDDNPAKAEQEMAGLPAASVDEDLNRLVAKRWLSIGQAYLDADSSERAIAALTRALAHGAPSVVANAQQALDKIGAARQTAQAGGAPLAR